MKKESSQRSRRSFVKKVGASALLTSLPINLFPNDLFNDSPEWKKETDLPYKLQEIYCGVVNDQIHVAGGFISTNGTMDVSSHHMAFNPKTNIWKQKAALPSPRHHPQLIGHHGKLYAFGGFEVGGPTKVWIMHQQSWVYNAEEDSWTALADSPFKNGEVVSASLGDRIHLVGGRHPSGTKNDSYGDHKDTTRHQIYDSKSNTWSEGAPALIARNSAAGASINGLFYVVGGRTINGNNLGDLEIYNPKEDTWRKASPMPQGQGGLAAASVGGKLYAFGGEYFNNGGGVYKECWCYDPITDNWKESTPMRNPRHGLCGASLGNKIYAIGGAKKPSGNETSSLVESIQFNE